MAVAVALHKITEKEGTHVFLKTEKRMVSAREVQKVLALGVRKCDWVEVIVDGDVEEEQVMEQIERWLSRL